jgi:hypothetical protein
MLSNGGGEMAIWHKGRTYEESSYTMLLGQYRLVDDARRVKKPTAVAVIEEIIQKTEQTGVICWEELHTMDKALLLFLTREEMECRLLFLANIYREVAGNNILTVRMKIKISELKGVSDETLRGEIEELVDDLYRHLTLYTVCRKNRSKITLCMVISLIFLLICIGVYLYQYDGEMPPMIYVMIAGSIGGMISAVRRLQGAASTEANALTYIDLRHDWGSILLAPVYGVTFSLVLLLFFTSGFLKGDLFPVIATMPAELAREATSVSEVMADFFVNTYPATGADCAKLIVWSFIAGFAEKFVPDALDRLIVRSRKSEEKSS